MAFKSIQQYNESRYNGWFILPDDGDYADVIFLYEKPEDMMVCDAHYIKSDDYSGYVQCLGKGCPACRKNIRTASKLFIPLYNLNSNEVEIFDRGIRFSTEFNTQVFRNCPNPSEYVFRIIRHGAARSMDTTYEIRLIGKNVSKPFGVICAEKGIKFPDYYNTICREYSEFDLDRLINNDSGHTAVNNPSNIPDYHVTPRAPASAPAAPVYTGPSIDDLPEYTPESNPSIYSPAAAVTAPSSGTPISAHDPIVEITSSNNESVVDADTSDPSDVEVDF